MRQWKFIAAGLTAVVAGAIAVVVPSAGAATECAGTVRIEGGQAFEGDKDIRFPVTLSDATGGAGCVHSVRFELHDGSARSESDYDIPEQNTLSWQGSTGGQQNITVGLKADTVHEGVNEFTVRLVDPSGVGIGGPDTVTGTILDDDPNPLPGLDVNIMSTNGSTPNCTNCVVGTCPFALGISERVTFPVTLAYRTVNDTAVDGDDFRGVEYGEITIPAGDTQAMINIEIYPNQPGERNETFEVRLIDASAGTIRNDFVEAHVFAER